MEIPIKAIIEKWLIENNYDGLFFAGECACIVNDLIPCDYITPDCEAGYKVLCDCGEHDFHIQRDKP